jgi:type VI secretion system (T6SS) Tli4-like immunity protein
MTGETKENVQCIGRFRMTVPDAMIVAGRSQSIYRVDVDTVPMPTEGLQALWSATIAKFRPLPPPSDSESSDRPTFTLQPGVRAIWYIANPSSPEIRTLKGIKPVANHAVIAARSGETGRESDIEMLVKGVLDAYQPVTTQGFCVGFGSINSEPGLNEQTLISFDHKKMRDFDIRFETRTVSKPDTQTYSDVDEEKQLMASAGGKLNVLRDHSRSVAGLEGKEIAISSSAPGEPPSLRFTWHFPGVPQSSSKPMINIVASAPVSQQADLEKIWDAMLKSIQTVPPSPQRSQ